MKARQARGWPDGVGREGRHRGLQECLFPLTAGPAVTRASGKGRLPQIQDGTQARLPGGPKQCSPPCIHTLCSPLCDGQSAAQVTGCGLCASGGEAMERTQDLPGSLRQFSRGEAGHYASRPVGECDLDHCGSGCSRSQPDSGLRPSHIRGRNCPSKPCEFLSHRNAER